MKKSRYTDRQIIALLKQAQAGMDASMMARLQALEHETRQRCKSQPVWRSTICLV